MKQQVKAEIQEEIRDFLEFNKNKYPTCTILFKTKKIKVMLKRKFIAQMSTLTNWRAHFQTI